MIYNLPFLTVVALIAIGMYAMLFKKNLIKIAIGLTIVESGVNLFLITLGYREGGIAPIFTNLPPGMSPEEIPEKMVLPVPQALTLTSIVIGVAVLALILSLAIRIYRHYGTLNAEEVRRLKE
ncbi:MAG: cation:proton antiporter [Thermoplasmata archaeon]|nr:MAG: cation:proton antiporter [Thermoplasmata archaeon]KAA0015156.1 MAG: cation:proton antiporter [Thermoplasmata archaeon]OYT61738.1 MAG: cation:proton antiporter [Thermoplasmatales archaeon ex4484_30]